jgi:hypothetical protein
VAAVLVDGPADLSQTVQKALRAPEQPVVGVVYNAIDDCASNRFETDT